MASSVNPWLVGPQYWIGWEAFSWQTSWGYDENGEVIEVEHGGGGGSSRKKKEKPIKSRDSRDLMEMLSIIMTTGIIHGH